MVADVKVLLDSGTIPLAETTMECPVATYTDPARVRTERRLFADQPRVVAFSDQVRNPGDYVTDELSGEPLLIVRGEDGALRAFYNVCRHRGARVACDAAGTQRRFACPFHGWTYDTTGALRAIPDDEGFPDLDSERRRLRELVVVARHGLVWLLPDGWTEADLVASLGGLDSEFAGFDIDSYVVERQEVLRERFNWKFVIDGFMEVVHFRFLHPKTIAPYFRSNFSPIEVHGNNLRLLSLRRSYDDAVAGAHGYVDPLPHVALVYLLFPNTVLVWQGDHFESWTAYPDGDDPEMTVMRATLLAPKPTETEDEQRYWDRNWKVLMNTVLNEDFAASRQIQAGMSTAAQTHLIFGRNEPALQHFHRRLEDLTAEH